jgi:hypothetical protein
MLTEDYAKLSVASNTEMKTTGATKVSQKQGAALMSAMSLDVDDDLGADIADDFNDYDKILEATFCIMKFTTVPADYSTCVMNYIDLLILLNYFCKRFAAGC